MILVGQYDSPYTRRVAITMHLHGIEFARDARSVFAERTSGGYFVDFDWKRDELARYGLSIDDVEITEENFGSIDAIARCRRDVCEHPFQRIDDRAMTRDFRRAGAPNHGIVHGR